MRVIKAGELPGNKIHRGTCSNCKAQVEFTQAEATAEASPDPRDQGLMSYSVACPTRGCCYRIISYG